MYILQTKTYWKVLTPWGWNFKFLKSKNEIYQRIELRVDKKNDDIRLVMFTPKAMVIRMLKKAYLMYFLVNAEKKRPTLGKIIKCIWKVLFGPFTKYYGLWSSVLPLANCQHLKIQDFTSPLFTQHFFFNFFILLFLFDISTPNFSRTVTSKAY